MSKLRTFLAASTVLVLSACATATGPAGPKRTAPTDAEHESHHPAGAASAPAAASAPWQDRMKAMREMRDKMMNAKTPEERQALMAEHMKAMQGGMQMMKGMGPGMGGGMGMMGGGMGGMGMGGTANRADPAQRQQMMERRMEMMEMMMEMMMQRMPASGVAPAK